VPPSERMSLRSRLLTSRGDRESGVLREPPAGSVQAKVTRIGLEPSQRKRCEVTRLVKESIVPSISRSLLVLAF